jgi:hypothetical protein
MRAIKGSVEFGGFTIREAIGATASLTSVMALTDRYGVIETYL